MIIAIYQKPVHYSELTELTGLKPGSIYHHLRVLEPLIQKEEQGIYSITEIGMNIVESMELVDILSQKPNIKTKPITTEDDILHQVWLGSLNKILLGFTSLVTLLLGFQEVALAGSAIYAIQGWGVFLFDVIALFLGWGILYTLEYITPGEIFEEKSYILTIRLLSMLPGTIVGLGLLLMLISGSMINMIVFPYIFALTSILGLLMAVTGEYYLRALPIRKAVRFAALPVLADMLLGIGILLSY